MELTVKKKKKILFSTIHVKNLYCLDLAVVLILLWLASARIAASSWWIVSHFRAGVYRPSKMTPDQRCNTADLASVAWNLRRRAVTQCWSSNA